MRGQSPKTQEQRQYIRISGEEPERLSFPDEYFEDEDDDEDFLLGMDDDGDARKAKNEDRKDKRLLGEICFITGVLAVSATIIGIIVFISRVILAPFVKKFLRDLDW